ncbi:MAG: hypothetical protein AAFW47_04035 [Pseudomonadota bacterium]
MVQRFSLALLCAIGLASATASTSHAGGSDVIDVKVTAQGGDRWRFDVTVSHADTGWDHYANRWEVVGEDGAVLGTRVLAHPHVEEQPFTRSGTYEIPAGVDEVVIRSNDSVHGLGGREMVVKIPR